MLADKTATTSLNSCLAPLGSLDGVAISTVESLGNSRQGFSNIQGKSFASILSFCRGHQLPKSCLCPACHLSARPTNERLTDNQHQYPVPAVAWFSKSDEFSRSISRNRFLYVSSCSRKLAWNNPFRIQATDLNLLLQDQTQRFLILVFVLFSGNFALQKRLLSIMHRSADIVHLGL